MNIIIGQSWLKFKQHSSIYSWQPYKCWHQGTIRHLMPRIAAGMSDRRAVIKCHIFSWSHLRRQPFQRQFSESNAEDIQCDVKHEKSMKWQQGLGLWLCCGELKLKILLWGSMYIKQTFIQQYCIYSNTEMVKKTSEINSLIEINSFLGELAWSVFGVFIWLILHHLYAFSAFALFMTVFADHIQLADPVLKEQTNRGWILDRLLY